MIIDYHPRSAVLSPSTPKYAALADLHFNPAVGCPYGCGFCSIASTVAKSQSDTLAAHGISDPDLQHGNYLLVRTFDEAAFRRSLEKADEYDPSKPGHSGVVLISSTTDPYLRISNLRSPQRRQLQQTFDEIIERALVLLLGESSLKVRILTRSPHAKRHFKLFRAFGRRLMFGMSVPTLSEQLSAIYEPNAPSPAARLRTLRAAKAAGLNIFASMSPTYPECDEADLRATMKALAALDPVTIFHEPINIRGNNLQRLPAASRALLENWPAYALGQFAMVHRIAAELGILEKLHLFPDDTLENTDKAWFDYWRGHVPAWPQPSAP